MTLSNAVTLARTPTAPAPTTTQPAPAASTHHWGLHVEEFGDQSATQRPPVALLHGMVASSRFWRGLSSQLAPQYDCCAPDLLGFGRSPWPDVAYSVDDHVNAIERSLFASAPTTVASLSTPLTLVGHSTGAIFAVELAARRPDDISRVVLFSPPYFTSTESAIEHVRRMGFWAGMILDMPRTACVLCHLICQRRRFWRHILPWLLRDLPREVVEDGMMHSFVSVERTMRRCIIEHRLDAALTLVRERNIPVTVVHPQHDDVVTRATCRELARRFELELHEVDDHDHLYPLRDPASAARHIAR